MENPFSVSLLNDFVFCPASIYFHSVDAVTDKIFYESKEQQEGSALHEKTDCGQYSNRKNILQGISVYCEEYKLIGKIDVFDEASGILTERKRKITKIYDGYHFQLYAYCFALREMGYMVKQLQFHSMLDNKNYRILLPEENPAMLIKFKEVVHTVQCFDLSHFRQTNSLKCSKCVYEPLCSFSERSDSSDHCT